MSIWKSKLATGCALGMLITVGVVNTAAGGHVNHGGSMPGVHHQLPRNVESQTGHFEHPVYGQMIKHPVSGQMIKHPVYGYKFKHPVYGYMYEHLVYGSKFKHPVYGYVPTSTVRQNVDDRSETAMEREAKSVSSR